ncbi:MAG: hypothetical protein JW934_23360 [Anaerolineae bacterium]|nr:hypothetical protein [Anaerolineae bacterium]
MSPRGKRLNASEIGHYAYCARAWWFEAVKKLDPLNFASLNEGTSAHEQHGWRVIWARGLNRLALGLFGAGVLLLLVWGLSRLVG